MSYDKSVPTPDTGDHSNMLLYLALMGAAAAGTGLLLTTRKKTEEE